jgi:alkanesulfonate monooxygenase SsuD/methylene tetrahydromethanopterin reductase-like flavin-dependent oxidoreductase (luciferase family)
VTDPPLTLARAAGRTSRLHLGADLVPPARNRSPLAKELAQLDQLCGGWLLLSPESARPSGSRPAGLRAGRPDGLAQRY